MTMVEVLCASENVRKIESILVVNICIKFVSKRMAQVTYETLHRGMNPQQYLGHVLELATHDPYYYANVYSAFQELSYALHFASLQVIKSMFTILFEWLKPFGPDSNEVMYLTYHMAPIFDLVVPRLNSVEIRMAVARYLTMVHVHIDMDSISQNWLYDAERIAYFQEIKGVIGTCIENLQPEPKKDDDTHTCASCGQDWQECIDDLVRLLA